MHQGVVDLVPAALQHSIGFVRSGSAPPVANSGRDEGMAATVEQRDSIAFPELGAHNFLDSKLPMRAGEGAPTGHGAG